ncbi:PhoU domain-containing protein, partial [Candidatus Sumerlaeota bacterium]|nr:PhoU domain-containing protein [Candidatus Sumerlaeota bacterium]
QAIDQRDPQSALDVLAKEKLVNRLRKQFDNDHIERLKTGVSPLPAAPFFMDAIHNMEKIGDHIKNIAQTAHNLFTWSKGKTRLPKDIHEDNQE